MTRLFRAFSLTVIAFFAFSLSLFLSLSSAYAIQLQYNFKEKTVYKTIQKMSAQGSMVMGEEGEIPIGINGNFTELIRVKSVEENGDMTLIFEYTPDSFLVSFGDQSQQMPSEKMRFQIKIDKRGKLIEHKNLSENSSGGDVFDISDIFATFLRFPEEEIQKGDEWTISEAKASPFGIDSTGKLLGFEEINSHNCAKIKTTATMPLTASDAQMRDLTEQGISVSGSQQVEYTSYFSTDLGVLLKGSGKIVTKTDFFMNGESVGNMLIIGEINESLVDVKPEEEFEED